MMKCFNIAFIYWIYFILEGLQGGHSSPSTLQPLSWVILHTRGPTYTCLIISLSSSGLRSSQGFPHGLPFFAAVSPITSLISWIYEKKS